MRLVLLVIFIIASFASNAQGSYNFYFDWEVRQLNENPIPENLKGQVKEMKVIHTYKKPKNTVSVDKQLNEDGLVTEIKSLNSKGETTYSVQAEYNEKGNITKFINHAKNGNTNYEKYNLYDDEFRMIETKSINNKGKIVRRSTWTFGESKCATASSSFVKGGQKVKRNWVYEFYRDCDPSKTTLTNAKGKVLQTWTYDCKQEGEQLTKKKDETQICKWEESDGKYLIKIYQNFNEKGKVRKQVQKYTLEDTLIVESISYDENDKIRWEIEYDKSFDRQKSYISYSKKGKERTHREKLYVNSILQSSVIFYKGKKTNETFYTYNSDGWLTKVESFGKKDQKLSSSKYEYVR